MIRHKHTATGIDDPTKQLSVNRWNEEHLIDGGFTLPIETDPTTPEAGSLAIYVKQVGGRSILSQLGSSGRDTAFQPHLGGNKCAMWMPPGGATTVPGVFGMSALTATGTGTTRGIAVTNVLTRMTRLGYVSATTAGALCGAREPIAKYTTGAGGGLGGFHLRTRFGVSDAAAVAGSRMFVGMQASNGAPTNINPPTIANCIGVAEVDDYANLCIVARQGIGDPTIIDLGPEFPILHGSVIAYELSLFSPPGGGVRWQVNRLNHSSQASGDLEASQVPVGSQLITYNSFRTNNTTALAVGLDICSIYIESDY